MITSGIVCDNYKVEKFKKELVKAGFSDFVVTENKKGALVQTSIIQVKMETTDIKRMKKLCQKVEMHFKLSN